jgi:hypothetical protein
VRVTRHVDRDAVDRTFEVGSVVELEAAQIVLIGFAFAAVLANHETRYSLEHFTWSQLRASRNLLLIDRAFGGR